MSYIHVIEGVGDADYRSFLDKLSLTREAKLPHVVGRALGLAAHLENDALGRARRGKYEEIKADAMYEFFRLVTGLGKVIEPAMLNDLAQQHHLATSLHDSRVAVMANVRKSYSLSELPLPKLVSLCFETFDQLGRIVTNSILGPVQKTDQESDFFPIRREVIRQAVTQELVSYYKKQYA
jgi:hypothetical protein